jgi:hypothetical protein
MGLVITRGLPETFVLEKSDPQSQTTVSIKPATVAEQAQRDELWAKQSRKYYTDEENAVEVKTESTFSQRIALEVFLTLVGCNIKYQDMDGDGDPSGDEIPMFNFGARPSGEPYLNMSRDEFLSQWGKLPASVAEEIHQKVLAKNPQWDMFR